MGKRIQSYQLADSIIKSLTEYSALATDEIKQAVRSAGDTVRNEIEENAPKDTGNYSKSWVTKKRKETATSLKVVVHSKDHYQLAHLLEFGHAKRGGGRVAASPHISQAEDMGISQFEASIREALEGR